MTIQEIQSQIVDMQKQLMVLHTHVSNLQKSQLQPDQSDSQNHAKASESNPVAKP